MFSFSMPELILILVIALVVFGPGKLPEVGKAIGKSLQEFRKATSGEQTKGEPIKVGETKVQEQTAPQPQNDESKSVAQKAEEKK